MILPDELLDFLFCGSGMLGDFFAYMLWGGWDMVLGAGRGGNPPDVQKAWNKITYGLMGFLIVVSSFFILQIVSTVTGINFISPNI